MEQHATAEQRVLGLAAVEPPGTRWFSGLGCVVSQVERTQVCIAGTMIAAYDTSDVGSRNAVLVGLCQERHVRLGRVATAFGLSEETLRQIRRRFDEGGLAAVTEVRKQGRPTKMTPKLQARVDALFQAGLGPMATYKKLGRDRVSHMTIRRMWESWKARQAPESVSECQSVIAFEEPAAVAEQMPLPALAPAPEAAVEPAKEAEPLAEVAADEADEASDNSVRAEYEAMRGQVQPGRNIQYLGTWVLFAIVLQLGLYKHVAERCEPNMRQTVRVMLDAVIAALALGQQCVEGVRRVATPTASALLRASRCPSASWVRRVLGLLGQEYGYELHYQSALEAVTAVKRLANEMVIFYVDNHTRPYTGKHTVRKAWRMQDKRARPGMTDYWVHDEDGRPVMRFESPSHEPLTKHLTPVAATLRKALGSDIKMVLIFDRAGAFPAQLRELRNAGVYFVTYERRPYPSLASTAFTQTINVRGEKYGVYERRTNLGKGRGRVWRVSLKTPEGRQINILTTSDLSTEFLVAAMFGRWRQENGFKHGVERWGFNQLEGRKVDPYAPDAVIPNPARRRLDRALRIARQQEGAARSKLARLPDGDPRRNKHEQQLDDALELQEDILAQRVGMPMHAEVANTELAGKLVQHSEHLKRLIDTIRVTCSNAESELALLLAPSLPRPREVKKALATLFSASGDVATTKNLIMVTLRPAGTAAERAAFQALLGSLCAMDLTLPGDPSERRLRFRCPE